MAAALASITLIVTTASSARANNSAPQSVVMAALSAWVNGNQGKCEDLLAIDAKTYPKDQTLAFFRALCRRSRWEIGDSFPLLKYANSLNPSSSYGKASYYIAAIDTNHDVDKNYGLLGKLCTQNPKNILLLWSAGFMSRHLERTEPTVAADRCYAGIAYYKRLEALLHGRGSAIVHQTYGNLLDDAEQYKPALHERLLAVKEEPMPWSLNALANTYDELKQPANAAKVRARLAREFPGQ